MTREPAANGRQRQPPPSGMFERLEKLAEDALARDPGDVSARIALAELLCGRSDYHRALVHFHEALGQAPDNPRLIGSLARTCRDIGESESFFNLLSRLRRIDPQHILVRTTAKPPERAEDLFHGHRIYEIDH
jgi:cytochrome c-type biogenesis protein CcmH/NrfG